MVPAVSPSLPAEDCIAHSTQPLDLCLPLASELRFLRRIEDEGEHLCHTIMVRESASHDLELPDEVVIAALQFRRWKTVRAIVDQDGQLCQKGELRVRVGGIDGDGRPELPGGPVRLVILSQAAPEHEVSDEALLPGWAPPGGRGTLELRSECIDAALDLRHVVAIVPEPVVPKADAA